MHVKLLSTQNTQIQQKALPSFGKIGYLMTHKPLFTYTINVNTEN